MLGIALVLLWVLTWTPPVHAECVVDTDSPTFVDGKRIDLRCNASGELITSGGGGGGSGSAVQTLTIASGVTTNTTTAAVAGVSGYKTFWMEVRGTGAVTATVTIYGARVANATDDEMVALTTPTALSGTTVAVNAAATSTAPYPYYYVTTENVTGTGATVAAYAFY
jgi:hypothetical protein